MVSGPTCIHRHRASQPIKTVTSIEGDGTDFRDTPQNKRRNRFREGGSGLSF